MPIPTKSRAAPRVGSLGLKSTEPLKVARQLKAGLPFRAVLRLQKASQLSLETIAKAIRVPRRTLARRRNQGRLTGPESERLYRLSVVFEKAVELFDGDTGAARTWLETSSKALGQESPLSAVETDVGAREVEDLIGRLEHGVFT